MSVQPRPCKIDITSPQEQRRGLILFRVIKVVSPSEATVRRFPPRCTKRLGSRSSRLFSYNVTWWPILSPANWDAGKQCKCSTLDIAIVLSHKLSFVSAPVASRLLTAWVASLRPTCSFATRVRPQIVPRSRWLPPGTSDRLSLHPRLRPLHVSSGLSPDSGSWSEASFLKVWLYLAYHTQKSHRKSQLTSFF